MDALDRLEQPARALLGRVDATLVGAGLPVGHPALGLLREMRALPGEVFAAVADLRPETVRAGADAVRPLGQRYRAEHAALAVPPDGSGVAAGALRARCLAGAAYLAGGGAGPDGGAYLAGGGAGPGVPGSGVPGPEPPAGGLAGPDTVAGRLGATVCYLVEVAEWMRESRLLMAETVARSLGSAEAVSLHATPATGAGNAIRAWLSGESTWPGGSAESSRAAAAVAARILLAGREIHRAGLELHDRWSGRLIEAPYRAAARDAGPAGQVTWLPL